MRALRPVLVTALLTLAAAAPASARTIDAVVAGPPVSGRVPVLLSSADATKVGKAVVRLAAGSERAAGLRLGDHVRVVTRKLASVTSVRSLSVRKRSKAPTFATLTSAEKKTAAAAQTTIDDAKAASDGTAVQTGTGLAMPSPLDPTHQTTPVEAIGALRAQVNVARRQLTALATDFDTVVAIAESSRPTPGARRTALTIAQGPYLQRLGAISAAAVDAAQRAEETSTALDEQADETQADPSASGGLPVGVGNVTQLSSALVNLLGLLSKPCAVGLDGRATC